MSSIIICHKNTCAGKRCRLSSITGSAFCKRHTIDILVTIRSKIVEHVFAKQMLVINRLLALPQPEQRTPAWFELRKSRITASEASKCILFDEHLAELAARGIILASPEKFKVGKSYCNPYESRNKYMSCKADLSPKPTIEQRFVEWGVCYEPITTRIYELMYNTKVYEFGLLPHSTIPFIGASPDGISTDLIMLEIKNPFTNRPVGAPAIYYWIQMQMQMEVADLWQCDFFDVRIREFRNKDVFLADTEHEWKGCAIKSSWYENDDDEEPKSDYFYTDFTKPWAFQEDEIWNWLSKQTRDETLSRVFGTTTTTARYWYVDEISCRRIDRDKEWFHNTALPQLEATWKDICTLSAGTDPELHEKVVKRIKLHSHIPKALTPTMQSITDTSNKRQQLLILCSSDDDEMD